MVTDYDLAQLQLSSYKPNAPAYFEHWQDEDSDHLVTWGLKSTEEIERRSVAVIFRGSQTPLDWALDFFALPYHPCVWMKDGALVHAGMFAGIERAVQDIQAELLARFVTPDYTVYLGGHSLGGAHAAYAARLLNRRVFPRVSLTTWGCPQAGNRNFWLTLPAHPQTHYVNGFDPVPHVPFHFAAFPYAASDYRVHLSNAPDVTKFDAIAWHDMKLYARGVAG